METLFDSLTPTHLWFGLFVVAFLVAAVASNWLLVDLEERGLHKRRIIGNHGLVLLKKAAALMADSPDPSTQLKYGSAVLIGLTCFILIPFFFYCGVKSMDEDPCDVYTNYLEYSVDGTVSYRITDKRRRIDPVYIYLKSGPLEPCTYSVSEFFDFVKAGDHVKKSNGDSLIYVNRQGEEKVFNGTKQAYGCNEK